jgi:peptidoglycan/xylan/chitin deacetylase (PgdA/CDA1 family)
MHDGMSSIHDRPVQTRGPRHAVGAPPPGQDDDLDRSSGRHRRPESLADRTQLRPSPIRLSTTVAEARQARHRWLDGWDTMSDTHPADELIRQVRRAAGRIQTATGHPQPIVRAGRHAQAGQRGRHALPADRDPLAITVRPINEGLTAFRDWALYTGDSRPVTGSRRAPGTLPIESWLLIGRTRQQALLASLVAVSLALVMIPTATRRGNDVDPVTAAGNRTVTAEPATPPEGRAAGKDDDQADARPDPRPEPTAPATTTPNRPPEVPPSSAPAPSESPIIAVPPGDGPHRSWKTTGSRTVALTFDDGPDPVQTPRLLALLDRYRVKATFCLVGAQAERHPEIVRQIAAAGHTLCNHTWDHSLVIGLADPAAIEADLARTSAAIRRAVPDAEIPFFRAPGGNFTDRLVQVAYADGMTSLYWDVDPRDWDHRAEPDDESHADQVVAEVQKFVKPGSIVLSHDFDQPDTVLAYEKLLPYLTENYELGVPAAAPPPAGR